MSLTQEAAEKETRAFDKRSLGATLALGFGLAAVVAGIGLLLIVAAAHLLDAFVSGWSF